MNTKKLVLDDMLPDYQDKISVQSYKPGEKIDGVKIEERTIFSAHDGTFEELLRVSDDEMLVGFDGFKLKQVNRSILLPNSIKAWHVHLNQEDVWYVPPQDYVVLGLWDMRKNSKTAGKSEKIVMGGGRSRLVYIPRGVAHGGANFSHAPATIFYFVNQHFDMESPDEKRISWDALGEGFWVPERG